MGLALSLWFTLFASGNSWAVAAPASLTPPASEQLLRRLAERNSGTEQLLWVLPPKKGFQTQVHLFEKTQGRWKEAQAPIVAVVGQRGLAETGQKQEGDRKTPQGLFALGKVFGKNVSFDTKMPYEKLQDDMKWIDDPRSRQYNRLVRGPTSAESYETMLRNDELYDLVMVLEYNTEPVVPGKGSAIFMHIWESPSAGTAGCVAMARSDLENVLKWLAPEKKPQILVGPLDVLPATDAKGNQHL